MVIIVTDDRADLNRFCARWMSRSTGCGRWVGGCGRRRIGLGALGFRVNRISPADGGERDCPAADGFDPLGLWGAVHVVRKGCRASRMAAKLITSRTASVAMPDGIMGCTITVLVGANQVMSPNE